MFNILICLLVAAPASAHVGQRTLRVCAAAALRLLRKLAATLTTKLEKISQPTSFLTHSLDSSELIEPPELSRGPRALL